MSLRLRHVKVCEARCKNLYPVDPMKKMIQCKACGYIMREDSKSETCPACGVPRKAFVSWNDPVSPRRRAVLNLDLHPIALHFPQAFSALVPVLILADHFSPLARGIEVNQAVRVLSVLVFPAILGAYLSGLIDGHTRFRKLNTTFLRAKIILGAVSLGTAFGLSYTAFIYYTVEPVRWLLFTLSLACLAFQAVLAQVGKRLMGLYLPG